MNSKELEALVLKQGETIAALQEALGNLTQRADNIVEGFNKELAGRDQALTAHKQGIDDAWVMVKERMSDLRDHQDGMNDTLFGVVGRIEVLEKLVLARNASAPTKRNMTDEDALRVMTGDLKDLAHKDAAERIGLTYAQVYSCRLEFTFKHVHKNLRDGATSDAPWSNPWSK